MKKNIKYILIFLIMLVIVAKILEFFVEGDKESANEEPNEYKLSAEDSSVFSGKFKNEHVVDAVYKTKGRNNVSIVELAKKYRIMVTKTDLAYDLPLDSVVNIKFEDNDLTSLKRYRVEKQSATYEIDMSYTPHKPVKKVFLSVKGDLLQMQRSDSAKIIMVNAKNMSLRYEENEPTDLYIDRMQDDIYDRQLKPMSILFLKRNREVYIIVMSVMNLKDSIPYNLPLELIKK